MGKRLDQPQMYPQYTYYYPHYLQTKQIVPNEFEWMMYLKQYARRLEENWRPFSRISYKENL